MPRVDPRAALSALAREVSLFAALLDQEALAEPVPSCPGWTVADLARHLGGVHRWARQVVLVGQSREPQGPTDPEQVRPWFHDGAAALIDTLAGTDPGQPCWTLAGPGDAAFWMRRQAHETTLHRWDAATGLGIPSSIDEAVAADGIDEVATVFVPRQIRLGRLTPGPEVIDLVTDSGQRKRVSTNTTPPATPPTVVVSGPAETLLLLLWKRTSLDDDKLSVSGDRLDADRLLGRPLTP